MSIHLTIDLRELYEQIFSDYQEAAEEEYCEWFSENFNPSSKAWVTKQDAISNMKSLISEVYEDMGDAKQAYHYLMGFGWTHIPASTVTEVGLTYRRTEEAILTELKRLFSLKRGNVNRTQNYLLTISECEWTKNIVEWVFNTTKIIDNDFCSILLNIPETLVELQHIQIFLKSNRGYAKYLPKKFQTEEVAMMYGEMYQGLGFENFPDLMKAKFIKMPRLIAKYPLVITEIRPSLITKEMLEAALNETLLRLDAAEGVNEVESISLKWVLHVIINRLGFVSFPVKDIFSEMSLESMARCIKYQPSIITLFKMHGILDLIENPQTEEEKQQNMSVWKLIHSAVCRAEKPVDAKGALAAVPLEMIQFVMEEGFKHMFGPSFVQNS